MNERMKVLAEQAELYGVKEDRNYDSEDISIDRLEKFATLIVNECLEACSRANETRHLVPPTRLQVVLDCMREIETTLGFRK